MMKILSALLLLPCLCSTLGQAASLGAAIDFAENNGQSLFGVQYAYEPGTVMLNITGTLNLGVLPPNASSWKMAIYDQKSNQLISGWMPIGLKAGTGFSAFTSAVSEKESLLALKALPDLSLVFSANSTQIDAHINLATLCEIKSGHFVDLSYGTEACRLDQDALASLGEAPKACPAKLKNVCAFGDKDLIERVSREANCTLECK